MAANAFEHFEIGSEQTTNLNSKNLFNEVSGDLVNFTNFNSTASNHLPDLALVSSETTSTSHDSHAKHHEAHAKGNDAHAKGQDIHAKGHDTNAKGQDTHAKGHDVHSKGTDSHAGGPDAHPSGHDAHVDPPPTGPGREASGRRPMSSKPPEPDHGDGAAGVPAQAGQTGGTEVAPPMHLPQSSRVG